MKLVVIVNNNTWRDKTIKPVGLKILSYLFRSVMNNVMALKMSPVAYNLFNVLTNENVISHVVFCINCVRPFKLTTDTMPIEYEFVRL